MVNMDTVFRTPLSTPERICMVLLVKNLNFTKYFIGEMETRAHVLTSHILCIPVFTKIHSKDKREVKRR